jgi:hypothetical protein
MLDTFYPASMRVCGQKGKNCPTMCLRTGIPKAKKQKQKRKKKEETHREIYINIFIEI